MKIPKADPRQHDPALNEAPPIEGDDPFRLFEEWFEEARSAEPADPNAMSLATVGPGGMPNVRMVLLKEASPAGFVFYTNLDSEKGEELAATPKAALCFHWKSLLRQVRVQGPVVPVSAEEADAYYASRDRGSRIGAWASKQSRPLESRFALQAEVAKTAARYAVGEIPRPPFWSGFRVVPTRIEFWKNGAFRLHDRLVFRRPDAASPWTAVRLYP
ncbi:pyridoxamine 5'-phosphate oxidase [Futiania mangrovi]|uniref:Pyridoxine/pyridoxamine 5'-phosphate oxidase n=1 Tax=Futiania mangrovi TaxID=2959716 RepID=A0A9J6PG52_9PROT|nr:pyridoxamine 5'-phosphate oxidase [Futiania mangrovii]MCP1337462.1 pyridoxamine 5'-phosphate oxidase [Futiania mangrovii]